MSSTKTKQSPHPDLLEKLEWYWLVCADEDLDAAAKVLASRIALYHHNKNTGQCDPSIATLAEGVGRVPRAINSSLAALRKAGWITWTATTGQRNQYRLERVPSRPEASGSQPEPAQAAAHPDDGEGVEGYAVDCTPPMKSTTGVPLKNTAYEPVREPGKESVSPPAQERAGTDTHRNASGGPAKGLRRPRQRQDQGTPLPANFELDEHRIALMVGAGVKHDELGRVLGRFTAHAIDKGRTSHHWDAALTAWCLEHVERRKSAERQQEPEKPKRTSRFQIL